MDESTYPSLGLRRKTGYFYLRLRVELPLSITDPLGLEDLHTFETMFPTQTFLSSPGKTSCTRTFEVLYLRVPLTPWEDLSN